MVETSFGGDQSYDLVPWESASPQKPWWERLDPHWSPEAYAHVRWEMHGRREYIHVPGPTGQKTRKRRILVPERKPLSDVQQNSDVMHRMVAALSMWQVLSTEQLTAFVGRRTPHLRTEAIRPAFAAGILERGRFDRGDAGRPVCDLWRLVWDTPFTQYLEKRSIQERLEATNYTTTGTPGRAHHRHQMLSAELALRLCELPGGPWRAVFGEPLVEASRLLSGVIQPVVDSGVVGDTVALRADGHRVVFEIVQRPNEVKVIQKMRAWAKLLMDTHPANSATTVVFVTAGQIGNEKDEQILHRMLSRALTEEGLTVQGARPMPGQLVNARRHIMIARWRDWFPGPWEVTTSFRRLTVEHLVDDKQWATMHLGVRDPKSGGHPGPPRNQDGKVDPRWAYPLTVAQTLPGTPIWAAQEPQKRLEHTV